MKQFFPRLHSTLRLAVISLCMAVGISIATSCSSDECDGNKNALPLAGFYNSFLPEQKVSVDSLQIFGKGAPGDSILSEGKSPKSDIYIPFRIDNDETTYIFRYLYRDFIKAGIADTVSFIYTRTPRFVSEACGVSYLFDIREIKTTHNLIDSVTCPQGIITNADIENIRIYFRIKITDDEEP